MGHAILFMRRHVNLRNKAQKSKQSGTVQNVCTVRFQVYSDLGGGGGNGVNKYKEIVNLIRNETFLRF